MAVQPALESRPGWSTYGSFVSYCPAVALGLVQQPARSALGVPFSVPSRFCVAGFDSGSSGSQARQLGTHKESFAHEKT